MIYNSDSDNESFKSFKGDEPELEYSQAAPSSKPSPTATGTTAAAKSQAKDSTTAAEDVTPQSDIVERFPPEEEATLVAESNTHKSTGNSLFGQGSYENAIQNYDRALSACPNYLDYELAVLRSNIAACHLKLSEWKEAVTSAEKGLDNLTRLEPLPTPKKAPKTDADGKPITSPAPAEEEPVVEEVDDALEARLARLAQSGHTLDEVRRLQIKLLLRRAKARTEVGGWSALQGAEEDYTVLLTPPLAAAVSAIDRRTVTTALRALAPRLNAARDQEMAEMMGKLKGLGNSLLKPFGLSTDNFQFTKDEKSGGYSMNFNQNPGKK